jgi:fumarate hydratase subunit beta
VREIKLNFPFRRKDIEKLKVGQLVLLNGVIYTARDQAHKKLVVLINKNKNKKLPFDLTGQIIYYCGPTPSCKDKIIGSCGPTTSSRMDALTLPLVKKGIIGMIGKGRRSVSVKETIKRYKIVYFIAPSGCGALLAKKVISKKLVAFPELKAEAIYKLEVKNFPLIVGIDSRGKDIYTRF